MRNIILIGMPGTGKSTVGVLLAKHLRLNFADTDIVMQQAEGQSLAELLDRHGIDGFLRIEEHHALSLDVQDTIIATGGSVVYSDRAMQHLRRNGTCVYLFTPLALLEMRLHNLCTRGVVMRPGRTLQDLFNERHPLYQRYADIEIDCLGRDHDEVVAAIRDRLSAFHRHTSPQPFLGYA